MDQLPGVGLFHWLVLLNYLKPRCLRKEGGLNFLANSDLIDLVKTNQITSETGSCLSRTNNRYRDGVLARFPTHIFGRVLQTGGRYNSKITFSTP